MKEWIIFVSIPTLIVAVNACDEGATPSHRDAVVEVEVVTCVDEDHDGYGEGPSCRGPDCSDTDPFNWISCDLCTDSDNDGWFVNCDVFSGDSGAKRGPDCDDTTSFCTQAALTCNDSDFNGEPDCRQTWVALFKINGDSWGLDDVNASQVIKAPDGNILIAASTSNYYEDSTGEGDTWLMKMNGDNVISWQKIIEKPGHDILQSLLSTLNGDIIVAVSFRNAISGWLMKLDAEGNMLWLKDPSIDINSFVSTDDGNFILSGSYEYGYGGYNGVIMKMSSDESIQWQTPLGLQSEGSVHFASDFAEGSFLAVGNTTSFCYDCEDGFIVSIDGAGRILWTRRFAGEEHYGLDSIVKADDQNYILVGRLYFSDDLRDEDIWVVKIDSRGEILWQKVIGGEDNDDIFSVTKAIDGNILIAGYTRATSGGATDCLLMKMDTDGNIVWQTTIGNEDAREACHSIIEYDSTYIIATGYHSIHDDFYDEWYDTLMVVKLKGDGQFVGGCSLLSENTITVMDTSTDVSTISFPVPDYTPRVLQDDPRSLEIKEKEYYPTLICPGASWL